MQHLVQRRSSGWALFRRAESTESLHRPVTAFGQSFCSPFRGAKRRGISLLFGFLTEYCELITVYFRQRQVPARRHHIASARIASKRRNAFLQQNFVEPLNAFLARFFVGQGTGIPRNQIYFDSAQIP